MAGIMTMICPTCQADRTLTPSGRCTTCDRVGAVLTLAQSNTSPSIPGAARSLYGTPPGLLFDVAEETATERRALKRSRRAAAKPITETVSPADDLTPGPQTPDKPGQTKLF
jgi:hypothetical protein